MRFTTYLGLAAAGLAGMVSAEDLLMHEKLKEVEYKQALALGYSVKLVGDKEWKAMTTADFAKYKAIVIADPDCIYDDSPIDFLTQTKDVWSPAIAGNIIVIGTDPSYHSYGGEDGADILIENSIKFAAAGDRTGLYFALSCYYHRSEFATIEALSNFGKFVVRGELNCYNNAHIVAKHPAMNSLSDKALSGWECSVHEAFSEYPTAGVGGFQALAIAKDILGVGSRSFGDDTVGLPYIISRGATPAGCGNAKYEPFFNEECDHGEDVNGVGDDLCSTSCKCLYGVLDASAGTCKPKPPPVVGTSTGIIPSYSTSVIPPYPTTSTVPPKDDCTVIVGIEVIVTVVVSCPEGSKETTTLTSTLQRPIYSTTVEGLPCYPCALGTPDAGGFITVSYTSYASEATPTLTYKMCQTCTEKTACTEIPGFTSGSCSSCTAFVSERPHVHESTATAAASASTSPAAAVSTVKSYGTIMPTTTGRTPAKPTTTTAFVTAGAPRNFVGGVGAGLLGGLIALAAL